MSGKRNPAPNDPPKLKPEKILRALAKGGPEGAILFETLVPLYTLNMRKPSLHRVTGTALSPTRWCQPGAPLRVSRKTRAGGGWPPTLPGIACLNPWSTRWGRSSKTPSSIPNSASRRRCRVAGARVTGRRVLGVSWTVTARIPPALL